MQYSTLWLSFKSGLWFAETDITHGMQLLLCGYCSDYLVIIDIVGWILYEGYFWRYIVDEIL